MVKMEVQYQGGMICLATHSPSKTTIETDAPTDNGGQGSRFSPTDLLGASLAGCMLTTIEILAEKEGRKIPLKGARVEVAKEMVGPPRRVGALHLHVLLPAAIAAGDRPFVENIIHTCPVARSLHPDLQQIVKITYL